MRLRLSRLTFLIVGLSAGPALGDALPTPYWGVEYELTHSSFQITGTPLGLGDGNFALWAKGTNPNPGEGQPGLPPGTLTLEFEDCGGGICIGIGGAMRLAELTLEQHFGVSEVYSDLSVHMLGDVHGSYDGSLSVHWDEPASLHTQGVITCETNPLSCQLRGLALGGNGVNTIHDQVLNDFLFNINTALPWDISSSWTLPPDPSGSTKTVHLRGVERGSYYIPEPNASLLVVMAFLGLGAGRALRRRLLRRDFRAGAIRE